MSELIKVTKDGEVIEVHPDALANHKQLGWAVVEEAAEPVAVETPMPVKVERPEKKKVVSRA